MLLSFQYIFFLMHFLFLSKNMCFKPTSIQSISSFTISGVHKFRSTSPSYFNSFKKEPFNIGKPNIQTTMTRRIDISMRAKKNSGPRLDSVITDKEFYNTLWEEPRSSYSLVHNSKPSSIKTSSYEPNTENQKKYDECLNNATNDLILVLGPAGTGKTLFACLHAIKLLKKSM